MSSQPACHQIILTGVPPARYALRRTLAGDPDRDIMLPTSLASDTLVFSANEIGDGVRVISVWETKGQTPAATIAARYLVNCRGLPLAYAAFTPEVTPGHNTREGAGE